MNILVTPEVSNKDVHKKYEFAQTDVSIAEEGVGSDRELLFARFAIKEMVSTVRMNFSEERITTFTWDRGWKNILFLKSIHN